MTLSNPATLNPVGRATRTLALAAVAGPALFALAWLVLGVISPGYTMFDIHVEGYSPVSQPISGLGLGVTAPYMNTAFVLGGLMTAVGVVAVFASMRGDGSRRMRRLCTVLMTLPGLGMILAGVFDLEAMMPHLTGFLLATGVPVAGFLVTGVYLRGIPRWRRFGTLLFPAALLTLILLTAFFASFDPTAAGENTGVAGLVQRALAVEVHGWIAAMGWLVHRGR